MTLFGYGTWWNFASTCRADAVGDGGVAHYVARLEVRHSHVQECHVSISTGGVLGLGESAASTAAYKAVMREISEFAPRQGEEDYVVDLGFWTGDDAGPEAPSFGVSPGPVGRTQHRFVVWHRPPRGLPDVDAVRSWFAENLGVTEDLVRNYLPRKSKAYPAEHLAAEIQALRVQLSGPRPTLDGDVVASHAS